MNSPGLWMIVATPVLVVVFVLVMRWATEPNPAVVEVGAGDDDVSSGNQPNEEASPNKEQTAR